MTERGAGDNAYRGCATYLEHGACPCSTGLPYNCVAEEPSPDVERIERAISEWYSAAWHRGVRITAVERELLARHLLQRGAVNV